MLMSLMVEYRHKTRAFDEDDQGNNPPMIDACGLLLGVCGAHWPIVAVGCQGSEIGQ